MGLFKFFISALLMMISVAMAQTLTLEPPQLPHDNMQFPSFTSAQTKLSKILLMKMK
jgi:hypothetical protein